MAGPGKKRYQISLTQETVERFQSLVKQSKLPPGTMSSVLDDSLWKVTETFEKLIARKEQGKTTGLAALFEIIGQQLEDSIDEVHKDEQKVSKKKK